MSLGSQKRRGCVRGGGVLCAFLTSLCLLCSCKFSLGSKINVKVGGNSKGILKVRASSREHLGPGQGWPWS